MEVRERDTRYQNNPPQSNDQESSPMFIYAPSDNQVLDPSRSHLHHRNRRNLELELQEEQMEGDRGRIESNPYPNPDPDPNPADPVSQPLPPDSVAPAVVVRYRECQKNHAASMGSHVLDGCGEFMPNGEEGTPEGFKCAACECHRSFHRREVEGETRSTARIPVIHAPPPQAAAMQQLPYQRYQMPPVMVAFGGNNVAPTESSSEDLDMFHSHGGRHMNMVMEHQRSSKKRFRTKFTEEQKEKMHDFAEKIGWKIQKQDEQEILQFCNEVGLKRQVFKVWMHNSKQAMKKKQP